MIMAIRLCQWDIVGTCNLNCTYCRQKILSGLPHLPKGQVFKIIDKLVASEVEIVSLAGGEPLTLSFLPEVLRYLRGKVKQIIVTTNGTLIKIPQAEMLKEYCSEVQVSIDGSCSAIHDQFRGRGTFDRAIAAVRLLVEMGVTVVLRLTICRENKDDTGNYVRLAHELGVRAAYLRRALPIGNYQNGDVLRPEELYAAFKDAFDQGKKFGIHVGSADYFSQLEFDRRERDKAEKNIAERPNQILSGCSIGIDAFYLTQDGKVLFCPYLPVYCGDLTKQSLSDVWDNSEMMNISRNIRWNQTGKCAACRFRMSCGGCPAYIFLTTGKLTESDGGCWVNDPVC